MISVMVLMVRVPGSEVKTHDCRPWIASSMPLTPTKITKRRYLLVFPRKNAPVYNVPVLYTGHVKTVSCVVGALDSILHYWPLIEIIAF